MLGEDGAPFLDSAKNKAYVIDGKSWVNNHAHVLRSLRGIVTAGFLCHYLNQFDYRNYVTGTTRLKLNQFQMKKIPILIPPLAEQHRIVSKIEELFTKLDAGVEALKKTKVQLKRYRQAVLKTAFEGKLTKEWREAQEVELEPALVLLERIRAERKNDINNKTSASTSLQTPTLSEIPDGWVLPPSTVDIF